MKKNQFNNSTSESQIKLMLRIKWKLLSIYEKIIFKIETFLINRPSNGNAIFLIGIPVHGNLGDHAIAIAEAKFLADYFPNQKVIEISGDHFRADALNISKKAIAGDIIIGTGGGFLGNLWLREEIMIRNIIELFPNNKVIIFPQTIFFDKSENAEIEFEKTKKIYQNHNDLHLLLREIPSYNFIKDKICNENFTDCRLVPDIVTYLNTTTPQFNRDGILLCLREDKEKTLTLSDIEKIKKCASTLNCSISHTTTVLNRDVSVKNREFEFNNKINEFKKAKLVITDRLHGMIFAAISSTPCIALNNSSGKVKGVYEFLKHLNYIRFTESIDDIPLYINELSNITDAIYENVTLKKYFDEIASVINNNQKQL